MSLFLPINKNVDFEIRRKARQVTKDFDAAVDVMCRKRRELFEQVMRKRDAKKIEVLQKRYGQQ
jgi:hypothetical protein